MGPDQDVPQKRENVKDLIQDYMESTSMHGASRAVSRSKRWKRWIWSVLVVVASGVAMYNFIEIIERFQTHPESTTVTLKYEPYLQFPAVTICNLNRIRLRRVGYDEEILIKLITKNSADRTEYFANRRALEEHLLYYSANHLQYLAHDIKDMLQFCSFDGELCYADEFESFYNFEFGMCHTIPWKENHSRWMTSKPGPAHGLSLMLNIEQHKYIALTPMAGIKVLIHNINEKPFPEEDGVTIGPGFATSIGIRRAETHSLPAPYGKCVQVSEEKNKKLNMYSSNGYGYTQAACQETCLQKSLYSICGCCLSSQLCADVDIEGNIISAPENASMCNSTKTPCIKNVAQLYTEDALECSKECGPQCDRVSYRAVLSTGTKLTELYAQTLEGWFKAFDINATRSTSGPEYHAEDNIVQLDIYYEQLIFESTTSRPAYDWNKLLSDTGGQMGLWLGFSLMTAVEMLELLIDLAMLCYRKLHNAHRRGNAVEEIN